MQNLNPSVSNMQQNNKQPQNMYNGAQNNQQIPILESEEEWLKLLRRQRQRKGFFQLDNSAGIFLRYILSIYGKENNENS